MTTVVCILALFLGLTLALLVIACLGDVELVQRLRKRDARIALLTGQRETFADVCEALTEGLCDADDRMAIKDACIHAQRERIAELEAREPPWLDEIRDGRVTLAPTPDDPPIFERVPYGRAAATGAAWGPSA